MTSETGDSVPAVMASVSQSHAARHQLQSVCCYLGWLVRVCPDLLILCGAVIDPLRDIYAHLLEELNDNALYLLHEMTDAADNLPGESRKVQVPHPPADMPSQLSGAAIAAAFLEDLQGVPATELW